jgi:hypothetical protein
MIFYNKYRLLKVSSIIISYLIFIFEILSLVIFTILIFYNKYRLLKVSSIIISYLIFIFEIFFLFIFEILSLVIFILDNQ